ncbi:MAG TPA: hypothetical protein VM899_08155 [Rubellimicrobium sp.]|nr:hypothetical protein [Rubellimicrobium sp.]
MMTLRDRLRADTAARHGCVDRAYSSLDITKPGDFRTFLLAHLQVLDALRCAPGHQAAAAEDLRSRMMLALRADLRELDSHPRAGPAGRPLDPTAVHYLLLGSSLGTQVLRRRWLQATSPVVAAAGRYLNLGVPPGAWRHLCDQLAGCAAVNAEADRTVGDTIEIFDRHLAALASLDLLPEGVAHV